MNFRLETPSQDRMTQVARVWEAGWHDAHADIVPAALKKLRTAESFLDRARANCAKTTMACADGRVVGFSMVRDDELYQMYVASPARGMGVAAALIEDAEQRIRANGYQVAWLACALGNDRAIRFYEKSGWTNAGQHIVELDTSEGAFPLKVLRFEKDLRSFNSGKL